MFRYLGYPNAPKEIDLHSNVVGIAGIDNLLASAVEAGEVPGVCALAATGGGTVYRGACGPRSEAGVWTEDTVAWLGSMTKMIVAVGALQLVEAGALDLDAPLGDLLPALTRPEVLDGFGADGQPRTRPAVNTITLRRLLSHTAGYGYHFWDENVRRYQETMGLPGIIECREATLTTPLVFEPGTSWEYGMNIDFVGKLIEHVTQQDLEEYLRTHVLDPLGMHDTTFRLTPDHRAKLAAMHFRTPEGPTRIDFEMTQEPEFLMGGGALYGSPADYLTLLRMLLGRGTLDGKKILRPETVELATRNQIGEMSIGGFVTVDPASSNDVEFMPGITKKWNLLGMINVEETPGGRSAGSLFWAGLPNCYFWIDWGKDNAGVLFTQLLPFGDPAVLQLFDRFENEIRGI